MLKKILGWVFAAVGLAWLALSQFTTAITLWPDLYDFWSKHMSGDPMIPWLLLLCGVGVLAWTYWPALRVQLMGGKMGDEREKLNQSLTIGTITGGTVAPVYNNTFNTNVAPKRAELSPEGIENLVTTLRSRNVSVDVIGDSKCLEIGRNLISKLSQSGVNITDVNTIGMQVPPPENPYSVNLLSDGTARLTISPATMP